MTNLLQFHQGLLLNTVLFEIILRGADNFLDDLFIDLALQTYQSMLSSRYPLPAQGGRLEDQGITNSDDVRHGGCRVLSLHFNSVKVR